jgi:hypothetical protein
LNTLLNRIDYSAEVTKDSYLPAKKKDWFIDLERLNRLDLVRGANKSVINL